MRNTRKTDRTAAWWALTLVTVGLTGLCVWAVIMWVLVQIGLLAEGLR